jgi:YtxH-like protein
MNDHAYVNDVPRGASGGSAVAGFVLGALVGAGIALLLAPATGGETRRKIGETARKLKDAAGERLGRRNESGLESSDPNGTVRPSSRETIPGSRAPRATPPGTPA